MLILLQDNLAATITYSQQWTLSPLYLPEQQTNACCSNNTIGGRRLDLFICVFNNHWAVFYYASSPTVTSDKAVQASVQQHGYLRAAIR